MGEAELDHKKEVMKERFGQIMRAVFVDNYKWIDGESLRPYLEPRP